MEKGLNHIALNQQNVNKIPSSYCKNLQPQIPKQGRKGGIHYAEVFKKLPTVIFKA